MTGNTTLEDNPLLVDAPTFDINGQVGQKTCGKGVGARSRIDAVDQPSGTVVSATNRQARRPLERERGRLAQTPYSDSAQTPTTGCLVSSMCITAHSTWTLLHRVKHVRVDSLHGHNRRVQRAHQPSLCTLDRARLPSPSWRAPATRTRMNGSNGGC